ncbi:hypothetical protein FQA39_LY12239 [Lamprigera yunnana]|nr:hypothetical protein FQA39_LY12239 [Lamprigera yunnana]
MARAIAFILLFGILTNAQPTMYKLNENSKLEADLVPVSSTVIPLPIYQVGYGIKVAPGLKGQKSVIERPEGPITLITAPGESTKLQKRYRGPSFELKVLEKDIYVVESKLYRNHEEEDECVENDNESEENFNEESEQREEDPRSDHKRYRAWSLWCGD